MAAVGLGRRQPFKESCEKSALSGGFMSVSLMVAMVLGCRRT